MKICLNMPGNGHHSNVFAKQRQGYLENLGSWVNLFASATMPIVASWQRWDLLLAGLDPAWVARQLPLLAGPLSHALLSQYDRSGNNPWIGHARAQFDFGIRGNLCGAFTSEYDLSRKAIMGERGNVLFAVAPDTFAYNEHIETLDAKGQGKLVGVEAVRYHDYTVVPMWGAEEIDTAFKVWQRFPSDRSKRDTLVAAIHKVASDPRDHIAVLYLDIEACLVGSNFGVWIWEEFFRLVQKNDLVDVFISFEEAEVIWRQKAEERRESQGKENGQALFARRLGAKWTAFAPQIDHIGEVAALSAPVTAREHLAAGLFTTSDVLSALHRKIEGDITLSAEGGSVIVGYDPTILEVAKIAKRAWRACKESGWRATAVVRALRQARVSDFEAGEDGRWFARRSADTIEAFVM